MDPGEGDLPQTISGILGVVRPPVGVDLTVEVAQSTAESLQADVQQILNDLNLAGQMTIRRSRSD